MTAIQVLLTLDGPWTVSRALNEDYPAFGEETVMERLRPASELWPDFSGVLRYETAFTLEKAEALVLSLGEVFESAEVWVNDRPAGSRICPPYRYDLTDLVQAGENRLRIEARTTLERQDEKGFLGPEVSIMAPSGVLGKVEVRRRSAL